MPPSEAIALAPPGASPMAEPATVRGWGGGAGVPVELMHATDREAISRALARARSAGRGAITRGLGRSYGDAAQLRGGTVIETSGLRWFELDPVRGTVTAQ